MIWRAFTVATLLLAACGSTEIADAGDASLDASDPPHDAGDLDAADGDTPADAGPPRRIAPDGRVLFDPIRRSGMVVENAPVDGGSYRVFVTAFDEDSVGARTRLALTRRSESLP